MPPAAVAEAFLDAELEKRIRRSGKLSPFLGAWLQQDGSEARPGSASITGRDTKSETAASAH
jgi:hypothetical protein